MANNIRDLAEWYPFIPKEFPAGTPSGGNEPPALAAAVLDMSILVELDATDKVYGMAFYGECAVSRVELTGISDGTAHVRCHGGLWETGYSDIELRVLVGRDARGIPGTSYMVMSEYMEFDGSLDIHPACLMFMQRAPKLNIWSRDSVDVHEQAAGYTLLPSGDIGFVDYFNVSVSWENDGVSWEGAAGAGMGVWRYPPYSDISSYYMMHGSVGLRSICGYTDVNIAGSDTVSVDVELLDTNDIRMTITVKDREAMDESESE